MRNLGSRYGSRALALTPFVVVILALLLLRPGISGTFLFDDMANLSALDHVSLTDWSDGSLEHFLASNRSGPTGRPVAMLSFLLHEGHWLVDARPFLRTNLLIHCIVGLLLLGITRRLALRTGQSSDERATLFGMAVATLWLLHPLHASTVFYTVQRMAQLSALFSLASVYCYIVGRTALEAGKPFIAGMTIVATPLVAVVGAYAKENAILVPIALLLIEYWFFPNTYVRPHVIRWLRITMLWLPAGLIGLFLLKQLGSTTYLSRDFTATQRLLTQPRILLDYLDLLVRPVSITSALFNDTYPVSKNLWQPVTTIPAIAACGGLIAFALKLRRRFPLETWGILFFFSMHALESSTVPLELYYEHRNYLPSAGIMVAIAGVGFRMYDYRRYLGAFALLAALAVVAIVGHVRAQSWGRPLLQAEIWSQVAPDSPRVWANLALRNQEYGYASGVRYSLKRWKELQPEAVLPSLSLLAYTCPDEPIGEERWRQLQQLARHGQYTHGLLVVFTQLVNQSINGDCRGVRPDEVHVLLRSLLDNPSVRSEFTRQRLWHLDGQLLLAPGFIDDAMQAFRRSHQYLDDPPMRMAQARYLANRGYGQEALELLAAAEEAPDESIYGPFHIYWLVHDPGRIDALARDIRTDMDTDPGQHENRASAVLAAGTTGDTVGISIEGRGTGTMHVINPETNEPGNV